MSVVPAVDALPLPPFYVYGAPDKPEEGALNFSSLRSCKRFERLLSTATRETTAEVFIADALSKHPARTHDASAAQLFYVPLWFSVSYTLGACGGTSHLQRMAAAASALERAPSFARNGGADHLFAHTANGRPWIQHRVGSKLYALLENSSAGMEMAYECASPSAHPPPSP